MTSRSKKTNPGESEGVRLNRFLAMLGVGARRACDDIIKAGRVKVDGRIVEEPGMRVVPGENSVSLDNRVLENLPYPIILVLHKPVGYVTTVSDPSNRPTVMDLCKQYARKRRLFPVGRLDINTSGVLLLTNDGMLCYRLTHPQFEIPRIYTAKVRGIVDERRLRRLNGLAVGDRKSAKPIQAVEHLNTTGKVSTLKLVLKEGRNRQVRKMCENVGLRVVQLKRTQFGPVSVRKLPLGSVRPLEKKEIDRLIRMTK
jgi:23S rRNA pseudouridine2605 synthase